MKKFILFFFMLITTSSMVRADAITFEATVDSSRVSLDQALQLTLTFTGVNQDLDPVSLPTLDGFTTKYLGPSTSVSIVNGDYHSERSFVYNLFPSKVGHFQIPSITATIGGQTYSTKPIDVEVFEDSTQTQAAGGAGDQNQGPSTESLKDKIKVMLLVDRTNVYLNERVPLTIKLLVNGIPMRDIQLSQFDTQGFTVDPFQTTQPYEQVIDGIKYDIVEYQTYIYPDHPGDLQIGPVQIQGNVLYKTGQNNPFNQENNIFGADVFNNLFDSYATSPVTKTSQPVLLHVSPLPEDNRPQDFSGAIGQFDFQASVSPSQVKAGDPLTLKMDIKGSGNFKDFKMPVFQAAGFKTYEPQIKDTGNEKTAEEVIIPTSATIKEVPAVHFSYFDTAANDYKTITQGPFAVQVTSPSPDQDFKAVGFADVSHEPAVQVVNQISFGKVFNNIYKILRKLGASAWFWMGLGFILVAGGTYLLWRRFQYRLENDPAFARKLKAVREARKALVPAVDDLMMGRTKDFYALISRVLREYLANKWHQSSAALSVGEILEKLKSANVDETHITQLKTLLEQADLVCFAGTERSSTNMRADLELTQSLITFLEPRLK